MLVRFLMLYAGGCFTGVGVGLARAGLDGCAVCLAAGALLLHHGREAL